MSTLKDRAEKMKASGEEVPQMAIVFGDSFSGKTFLVGQLARKYKVMWVDTDKGYDTLFTAVPEEFWGNIELIHIPETSERSVSIKTIEGILKAKGKVIINEDGEIVTKESEGCVVWDPTTWKSDTVMVADSLSKVADSIINSYLGMNDGINFRKKEFDHYDKQGLRLKNLFSTCQKQKYHVVMISHQEELEQEDGSKKLTPIAGTRNFSPQCGRYFSHAIHCKVKNGKHTYNSVTTKENNVISGSRSGIDIQDATDIVNLFALRMPDSSGVSSTATKQSNVNNAAMLRAKLGK